MGTARLVAQAAAVKAAGGSTCGTVRCTAEVQTRAAAASSTWLHTFVLIVAVMNRYTTGSSAACSVQSRRAARGAPRSAPKHSAGLGLGEKCERQADFSKSVPRNPDGFI